MSPSGFERNLAFQIQAVRLPRPETQYRFAPPRRWTFDFCWPAIRLALEVEGGIWIHGGGRHNRASGFERDVEKYNEAALHGYAVLRVTTRQVQNGAALALVERALRRVQLDTQTGSLSPAVDIVPGGGAV